METIAMVFALAVIVEAVVQVVKGWVPDSVVTPAWLWPVVGALLGVGVCIAASADVFVLLGITLTVPFLGPVLTGIVISRGASFVHDVWGRINDGVPSAQIALNGFEESGETGVGGDGP